MRKLSVLLAIIVACSVLAPAFSQEQKQPTTRPARGWLGCKLKPNEDAAGIVIVEVIEKTPAAVAGLKAEDVITKLDGKAIEDIPAFVTCMRQTKPGDEIKFTVTRDKEEKEIVVKLGEVPKEMATTQEKPKPD